MGFEDGSWLDDGFGNNVSGGFDPSQLGMEDLPSHGFLNQVTDSMLPTGLDSYSDPNGGAIQQFLKMLRAGQPQGGQPQGQPGGNMADLSSVMGAFSSGEKANRIVQGNLTQNYDRLMLDAQKDRNANEGDALQKLAQTSYIMGGGSNFKPPTISLNGKSYHTPDLGFGPTPVTAAEKAGASVLQPQLQSRLMPGGSYTPQPLGDYAKPGIAENIGSYGAAGTGALGTIMNMLGNGQQGGAAGSTMNSIMGGVGKAGSIAGLLGKYFGGSGAGSGGASGAAGTLGTIGKFAGPVAGAALGTYGLAKNASVGSDVMSGAGAGASVGSMVLPGIGTAVGAGVGALVGALRGAFSVTGKEQGGRDAQAQITQNLSKLATPQQIADSKKAGWPDPNQALSLIVMRDKLLQSGLPGPQAEAQAEAIMHGMWNGEKSGSDAVVQAARPIQGMMAGNQGSPYTPFQLPQAGAPSPMSYPAGTDAFSRGAYKG